MKINELEKMVNDLKNARKNTGWEGANPARLEIRIRKLLENKLEETEILNKGGSLKPAYHPTTIRMHSNHCPHAVKLWKMNTPYDRSIFHTGVIAHAILERIGYSPDEDPRTIADQVVEQYCSEGRAYDGIPEPPSPFPDAMEGAELALQWHKRFPVPNGDGINHEEHFAFDENWNEVPYHSPDARFRTMLDVVEITEEYDEATDGMFTKAVIRDYKTSWVANAKELDTLQRRCQALVVYLRYKPDLIILEIANLRMKCHFRREINTHFEMESINQWMEDISTAIRTLDKTLKPRPGKGCIRCPYAQRCKHFDRMNNDEDVIKQYIAAKETVSRLEPIVKKSMEDKAPENGIGFFEKQRKKVVPEAKKILLEEWTAKDGTIEQLYDAIELSTTAASKIARRLTDTRQEREELMERITQAEKYASFGMKK
jgi:hypothetical protein